MGTELLANKWRPLTFEDVVGQENGVRILSNLLRSKKSVNSLLFTGPWGSGKTSFARIFSRALVCSNPLPSMSPCNVCTVCKDHLAGRSGYYTEVDAATSGGIDNVRRLKEESAYTALGTDKKRVITIDECHRLSQSAMDGLLKLFEEGSKVVYVLATTEGNKVPDTVRSRCLIVDLETVSPDKIEQRVKKIAVAEKIEHTDQALKLIAKYSNGHLRDAIKVLDQVSMMGSVTVEQVRTMMSIPIRKIYYELLVNLRTMEKKDFIEYLLSAFSGVPAQKVVQQLKESVQDCILVKYGVSFEIVEDKALVDDVVTLYGDSLESLSSYVKNIRTDTTFPVLLMELLLLKSLLMGENNFLQNTNVRIVTPPTEFKNELERMRFHSRKKKPGAAEMDLYRFAYLVNGRVSSICGE